MQMDKNLAKSVTDIAIVICTYNPNPKYFSRVVKAVEAIEIPECTTLECVIVDNNSHTPVAEMTCVREFIENCNWVKVITEQKQGLTSARIAGVKATTASIIVFIDDDNEPNPNYIKAAKYCLDTYSCVAVWGPGEVVVEFLDPVPDWFKKNFRTHFQERNSKYVEYGSVMAGWADFYPFGTGQILRREVFESYSKAIEAGRLASTDRKGGSLSSGGDIQIVWEAIKMGCAAGISPDLKMRHLIPGNRSNLQYIKRLNFGTASSFMPALFESFPAEQKNTTVVIPSNKQILKRIAKISLRRTLKFEYRFLLPDLADYIGNVVGMLRATNSDNRRWIYQLVNLLNFE